jgi:hypothetical protein
MRQGLQPLAGLERMKQPCPAGERKRGKKEERRKKLFL